MPYTEKSILLAQQSAVVMMKLLRDRQWERSKTVQVVRIADDIAVFVIAKKPKSHVDSHQSIPIT